MRANLPHAHLTCSMTHAYVEIRTTSCVAHATANTTIQYMKKLLPVLLFCRLCIPLGTGEREMGLHHVQSSTALVDQSACDACFKCWPGSHKFHERIVHGTWRGRSRWFPLTDDELRMLASHGLMAVRVPVRAGDVILWRSDLAHCGAPGLHGGGGTFRAVAYVSMRPACLTPPEVLLRKQEAFRLLKGGDHCASREEWHESKLGKGKGNGKGTGEGVRTPLPFFGPEGPALTRRQMQLYGLVSY